jgi:Tfp pilus assembly protein PilV
MMALANSLGGGAEPREPHNPPAPRGVGDPRAASERSAFSLLEVMVACGIFFMATFAILSLVAGTLRNARALQKGDVDVSIAAAQIFEMLKTNSQAELTLSGDFGDTYPDYSWDAEVSEYKTNGLLQVDVVLSKRGRRTPVDSLTFWEYCPNAKSRRFGGIGRP